MVATGGLDHLKNPSLKPKDMVDTHFEHKNFLEAIISPRVNSSVIDENKSPSQTLPIPTFYSGKQLNEIDDLDHSFLPPPVNLGTFPGRLAEYDNVPLKPDFDSPDNSDVNGGFFSTSIPKNRKQVPLMSQYHSLIVTNKSTEELSCGNPINIGQVTVESMPSDVKIETDFNSFDDSDGMDDVESNDSIIEL